MGRLLNTALYSIRSEAQQLDVRHPPKNWCVILRDAGDGKNVYYRLAKWSPTQYCWIDENLVPIEQTNLYTVYQETKYDTIAKLEMDAKELYELAIAKRKEQQEQKEAPLAQG